ncbi:hypothetical protein CHU98_g2117 [Xylaria longipes]|nr:hypothetical protein CHU98_g2117 [Xylaria longipes]
MDAYGLAEAQLILDINQPPTDELPITLNKVHFHQNEASSWVALRSLFDAIRPIHFAFTKTGVFEETDLLADAFVAEGKPKQTAYGVLEVNIPDWIPPATVGHWGHFRQNVELGT